MERLSIKMPLNKKAKQLKRLAKWIWLYPPYIGTGISVRSVNQDATSYTIQMKKRWFNSNAYGTHFGGSLYSMVDPFFVFAAASYFGEDYILWDKRASIHYVSPGKGTVTTVIGITHTKLEEMKTIVDRDGKALFDFETTITESDGRVVAEVSKQIYIRKK